MILINFYIIALFIEQFTLLYLSNFFVLSISLITECNPSKNPQPAHSSGDLITKKDLEKSFFYNSQTAHLNSNNFSHLIGNTIEDENIQGIS